jgi:hypothetical protein
VPVSSMAVIVHEGICVAHVAVIRTRNLYNFCKIFCGSKDYSITAQ